MSEWISVKLTRGLFCLIDKKDFILISKNKWQALPRHDGKAFYAVGAKGKKMHRIIMNAKKHEIVDHINGNGLDNRRENLRVGTASLNCVNRKNTPGKFLRGTRKKKNKFQAYIKVNGKQISLGYFETEKEAHIKYLKTARLIYNDWMPLPNPPEISNE